MMNLKNLLKVQFKAVPRWIPILVIVLVLIGFADATYLTVKHFQGQIPPCTIGGCETVLTSKYAVVAGIPISLLGAIYYLFLAILLFMYQDISKEIFLRISLWISGLGILFSLWLTYLQIFVIKAFCSYCAVSATISLIIFICAIYVFYKNFHNQTV